MLFTWTKKYSATLCSRDNFTHTFLIEAKLTARISSTFGKLFKINWLKVENDLNSDNFLIIYSAVMSKIYQVILDNSAATPKKISFNQNSKSRNSNCSIYPPWDKDKFQTVGKPNFLGNFFFFTFRLIWNVIFYVSFDLESTLKTVETISPTTSLQ